MKSVLSIILFGLLSSLTGKGVKSLTLIESPYVYMKPNWGVFLGETVKISCCSFYFEKDVNVYLEKDGQIVDTTPNRPSSAPDCLRHDFEITNVSLENGGMYSCYYYNPKTPSWSEHTESMELLIIDPRLPRPHISLSPSTYVHSGSNITIHCWAKGPRKRFYFHFEYEWKAPQWKEPDGDMANFTISNVSNAMYSFNKAIYHCSYRPLSGFPNSSERSDPVHLTLFDPAFYQKKPTIDLDPRKGVTLGGKITIYCERLHERRDPNMSFYLQRPGNQTPDVLMQPRGDKDEFFISNASWEHRGRYSCTSYYLSSISGNPVISEPSDPVELMIIDADLPRPNIAVSPSRMALEDSKIIILCWTNILSKIFYLHHRILGRNLRSVKPEGNMAKFPITMSWGKSGRYHCSYSAQSGNFTVSEISEDVQLFLIDFAPDRPTISLSPNKGITIGENVTIHCQHDNQDCQFCLQKPGDQLMDECTETKATWGKFLISNVNREHAGRYRCKYNYSHRISDPSEPVELLITDPDLPRPNISVIPNRMAFVGSNITIQCSTKGSSKTFYLHKDGGQIEPQLMESDGETATFSIVNINQSHGGMYKCSYRRPSGSSISSETSEAMDLQVVDPNLPRPAISINPNGSVPLGGQVTILCVAQDGPAMFYLHEAGDPMLNCSMEPKWDKGEFSINNISWEHQGNYSCSYAFYGRPFVFSEHSDQLGLLVSDPPETMDYAQVNNIRFAIGVVILLLLTYIVTSDYLFWKEQGRKVVLCDISRDAGTTG